VANSKTRVGGRGPANGEDPRHFLCAICGKPKRPTKEWCEDCKFQIDKMQDNTRKALEEMLKIALQRAAWMYAALGMMEEKK